MSLLADTLHQGFGMSSSVSQQFGVGVTPSCVLVGVAGPIATHTVAGAQGVVQLLQLFLDKPSNVISSDRIKRGDMLPDFALENAAGIIVTSKVLQGERTLLLFWNPRCGFCTRMIPQLQEWEQQSTTPRIIVASSGTAADHNSMKLTSVVLTDREQQVARLFAITGTPSAVLINENSTVISELAVGTGAIKALLSEAELKLSVQAAITAQVKGSH